MKRLHDSCPLIRTEEQKDRPWALSKLVVQGKNEPAEIQAG